MKAIFKSIHTGYGDCNAFGLIPQPWCLQIRYAIWEYYMLKSQGQAINQKALHLQ